MEENSNSLTMPTKLKDDIRKFLLTISQTSRTKYKNEALYSNQHFMSRADRHTVYLDQSESDRFQNIVSSLHQTYPRSKTYDKKYAEEKLRDAVFDATEPKGDPKLNAKLALNNLSTAYTIELKQWTVYIPISGFEMYKKTIWRFGKVTFIKSTNRKFKKAILSQLNMGFVRVAPSRYYATMEVLAADFSSANSIATEIIDLHCSVLDALNLISGSIKLKSSLSSYIEKGSQHNDWVIGKSEDAFGYHLNRSIALGGFSPHIFKYSYLNRYKWRYIDKELKNPQSSLFNDRTLPSLKWIGKAVFMNSNEEIYLYYAIALEALYFESKHGDKLMTELQIRMHKLLFTNTSWMSSAVTSYNNFSYIYDLRSKIVHKGGVEVSDNDIELMYYLVIPSLQKMLYYDRFRNKDSQGFEKWLMSGRKA